MRLKQNRLAKYYFRKAISQKDAEGGSNIEYGPADPIMAEMWAGGGKLQTEMYGNRLPNIRNLRLSGQYREVAGSNGKTSYIIDDGPEITAGDGVCVYAMADQKPDYRVIAIYPYDHLTLEVERL